MKEIKSLKDAAQFASKIKKSFEPFLAGRTQYGYDEKEGFFQFSFCQTHFTSDEFISMVVNNRNEINKGGWVSPTYRVGTEIYLIANLYDLRMEKLDLENELEEARADEQSEEIKAILKKMAELKERVTKRGATVKEFCHRIHTQKEVL